MLFGFSGLCALTTHWQALSHFLRCSASERPAQAITPDTLQVPGSLSSRAPPAVTLLGPLSLAGGFCGFSIGKVLFFKDNSWVKQSHWVCLRQPKDWVRCATPCPSVEPFRAQESPILPETTYRSNATSPLPSSVSHLNPSMKL